MPEKPAGMSWESFADAIVRKAMQSGEFDKLSGHGKPLKSLDQPYRDDWWLTELLQREELKVPCAALNLRAEVEQGLAKIRALPTESAVRRAVEALNARITNVNRTVTSGPSTSLSVLDVDAIVVQWRTDGKHRSPS